MTTDVDVQNHTAIRVHDRDIDAAGPTATATDRLVRVEYQPHRTDATCQTVAIQAISRSAPGFAVRVPLGADVAQPIATGRSSRSRLASGSGSAFGGDAAGEPVHGAGAGRRRIRHRHNRPPHTAARRSVCRSGVLGMRPGSFRTDADFGPAGAFHLPALDDAAQIEADAAQLAVGCGPGLAGCDGHRGWRAVSDSPMAATTST